MKKGKVDWDHLAELSTKDMIKYLGNCGYNAEEIRHELDLREHEFWNALDPQKVKAKEVRQFVLHSGVPPKVGDLFWMEGVGFVGGIIETVQAAGLAWLITVTGLNSVEWDDVVANKTILVGTRYDP